MSYIKAGTLSHSIELAKCVKLYAGLDGVFFFPYRGALSERKITLMAADLMEFYPDQSLTGLEHAIRNIAERCAWTSIGKAQDNGMVEFRGDGWMNMRKGSAVIIFNTYTGD